ncbi:MAG: DNA-processing protein DprA [Desulfovibrio sp.]|jgi:DNA processing protein|nr:DNA-processing protein DprA [Desulfovibrio sp.]
MAVFTLLSDSGRKELWACLALRHAAGIGPLRSMRLLEAYGSALAAVEAALAAPAAWAEEGLIPEAIARDFSRKQWLEAARAEWNALRRSGFSFLLQGDPDYPPLLRAIPDAPLLLYYKGNLELLRAPAVGVVGSRDCTREGLAVTAFFARALSRAGVTIISGLARGIDRAAHLAGLEGPGRSIALLGTGIDRLYPRHNADLAEKMETLGLLLSEFPPGTPAAPHHFPIRNRLISGLARGILVVEAAARSGSLITARLALEQGREVFAVPGHTMAAVSEGCRSLIRQGAKAVFSADDILAELAPLLQPEVRQALDKRFAEENRRKKKPVPRRKADDRHEEALATAESVLPEGDLPWLAPKESDRREKARPPARKPTPRPDLSPPEEAVLEALLAGRTHIDELARRLDQEVARLSGLLLILEMRGLVVRLPGAIYARPETGHGAA